MPTYTIQDLKNHLKTKPDQVMKILESKEFSIEELKEVLAIENTSFPYGFSKYYACETDSIQHKRGLDGNGKKHAVSQLMILENIIKKTDQQNLDVNSIEIILNLQKYKDGNYKDKNNYEKVEVKNLSLLNAAIILGIAAKTTSEPKELSWESFIYSKSLKKLIKEVDINKKDSQNKTVFDYLMLLERIRRDYVRHILYLTLDKVSFSDENILYITKDILNDGKKGCFYLYARYKEINDIEKRNILSKMEIKVLFNFLNQLYSNIDDKNKIAMLLNNLKELKTHYSFKPTQYQENDFQQIYSLLNDLFDFVKVYTENGNIFKANIFNEKTSGFLKNFLINKGLNEDVIEIIVDNYFEDNKIRNNKEDIFKLLPEFNKKYGENALHEVYKCIKDKKNKTARLEMLSLLTIMNQIPLKEYIEELIYLIKEQNLLLKNSQDKLVDSSDNKSTDITKNVKWIDRISKELQKIPLGDKAQSTSR